MGMKMDGAYIATVVLTGFIVVFIGLFILITCVKLMDWIFSTIEKKKSAEKPAEEKAQENVISEGNAADEPVIEDGIGDEIIAVISAAVASMSGGGFALKSVKKAKNSRRTAWGAQGINESTKIF